MIKPIRKYGAGIAPVDRKSEFVKIDDEHPPSGWECLFIYDYVAGGRKKMEKGNGEEKEDESEEVDEEEGWEMNLLGVYSVDE